MTELSAKEKREKELRTNIEYRVSCEERAHRIVERFIDSVSSEEMLVNAVSLHSPRSVGQVYVHKAMDYYRNMTHRNQS